MGPILNTCTRRLGKSVVEKKKGRQFRLPDRHRIISHPSVSRAEMRFEARHTQGDSAMDPNAAMAAAQVPHYTILALAAEWRNAVTLLLTKGLAALRHPVHRRIGGGDIRTVDRWAS